jgi:hypothetical protein
MSPAQAPAQAPGSHQQLRDQVALVVWMRLIVVLAHRVGH